MVETTIDLNIWPQDPVADIAGGTDEATAGDLTTELKRTRTENKTLIEMLKFLSEKYNTLRCQLRDLIMENNIDLDISKKRKVEEEIRPMLKNIDVSKVFVKVDPSDTTLVVRDGYQWRKYGQKVTRNNPSPRAYYKCSFSPSCPVKKKVQRSIEDRSLLAATYEGEHNHIQPSQGVIPSSISMPISTVALDSTQLDQLPKEINKTIPGIDHMPTFQQILVEQMANSLSKNPSFTTALASAISEQILDHDLTEIWDSKKT